MWSRFDINYFGHCHPQVTLAAWQEFDSQQEAVHEFVNKARSSMERDLNFSSPESLAVELDQARVSQVCVVHLLMYSVIYYWKYIS